jgi:hypothetical protein
MACSDMGFDGATASFIFLENIFLHSIKLGVRKTYLILNSALINDEC